MLHARSTTLACDFNDVRDGVPELRSSPLPLRAAVSHLIRIQWPRARNPRLDARVSITDEYAAQFLLGHSEIRHVANGY